MTKLMPNTYIFRTITLIVYLYPAVFFGQISGTVTDNMDAPILGVNIYIENTYIGTTSNGDGEFLLERSPKEGGVLVFQSLGFKSHNVRITGGEKIDNLHIKLIPEAISLQEVLITNSEDPAYPIMRKAIAARKSHMQKMATFRAEFYSRGLIALDSVPEKIFGQDIGDLDGAIDSTRSGVIYLSETFSKLSFRQPDDLIENIMASKVSGDNNGFSFNSARDVDFNLYRNTIEINYPILSPIANNALGTYDFKYEGDFYDDRQHLIYKIRVIPKRNNDRAFNGHIYIVDGQWAIYSTALIISGNQVRIPALDEMTITQSFAFDDTRDQWVLRTQLLDFNFGLFGFNGGGRFSAVYSNYEFEPVFDDSYFNNRILKVERDANKKDSLFWLANRPIPLTDIESRDYIRKDSIRILRESKPYLDSIDLVKNSLKWNVLTAGYRHQNSYEKRSWGFSGLTRGVHFNTVQGIHISPDFSFSKRLDENRRYWTASIIGNYGFSDKRFRPKTSFYFKFNDISRAYVRISAGSETVSFNLNNPISPTVNDIYTAFEDNYLKLYERHFLRTAYGQEWFNGLNGYLSLAYEERNPLFNNTDQVFFPQTDKSYTSNNPLNPQNDLSETFTSHRMIIAGMSLRINFGQKYLEYPNSKYNVGNRNYPTLYLDVKKGFGATVNNYNFMQVEARIRQSVGLGNFGTLNYNGFAGGFSDSEDLAFTDYKHFSGNQTILRDQGSNSSTYNLLEYYRLSTNGTYSGFHAEHHFDGYIWNRLPLLSKLNWKALVGFHFLKVEHHAPYMEWNVGLENIGFKKLKFLRIDYAQSYHNGYRNDGLLLGLNF